MDYIDDKAVILMQCNPVTTSATQQHHLDLMVYWFNKWKVKINNFKSVHTTFILRYKHYLKVFINNAIILFLDTVKYLGLHHDKRFTLNVFFNLKTKRLILNARFCMLKTLNSNKKFTNLKTKTIVYQSPGTKTYLDIRTLERSQ